MRPLGTTMRVRSTCPCDGLLARAVSRLPSTRNQLQNPFEASIMDIVVFMLIGLVAGWLAGVLVKGSSYGVVGDLVVGVLGALIGGSLFQRLGISAGGGLLGAIIVATVGAVILLVILRLINQSRMGSVRL